MRNISILTFWSWLCSSLCRDISIMELNATLLSQQSCEGNGSTRHGAVHQSRVPPKSRPEKSFVFDGSWSTRNQNTDVLFLVRFILIFLNQCLLKRPENHCESVCVCKNKETTHVTAFLSSFRIASKAVCVACACHPST